MTRRCSERVPPVVPSNPEDALFDEIWDVVTACDETEIAMMLHAMDKAEQPRVGALIAQGGWTSDLPVVVWQRCSEERRARHRPAVRTKARSG